MKKIDDWLSLSLEIDNIAFFGRSLRSSASAIEVGCCGKFGVTSAWKVQSVPPDVLLVIHVGNSLTTSYDVSLVGRHTEIRRLQMQRPSKKNALGRQAYRSIVQVEGKGTVSVRKFGFGALPRK